MSNLSHIFLIVRILGSMLLPYRDKQVMNPVHEILTIASRIWARINVYILLCPQLCHVPAGWFRLIFQS